jgi:hypothetical protein
MNADGSGRQSLAKRLLQPGSRIYVVGLSSLSWQP